MKGDNSKDTSNKEPFVRLFWGCYRLFHNYFSLVLLVQVGCFLISFCIGVCSLRILWRLC
jgi:hypothetical protein